MRRTRRLAPVAVTLTQDPALGKKAIEAAIKAGTRNESPARESDDYAVTIRYDETNPPGFTARWLAKAASRVENYPFDIGNAPSRSPYVAKNYMYARYGIPAITFEAGDESDRHAVRAAARIFAEELMQQMLDQAY